MKKYILLIIILFIITGCSTEYNLNFENNIFTDSIKIGTFTEQDFTEIESINPISTSKNGNFKYYNHSYKNNYLNLDYEYSVDGYKNSEAFTKCFELHTLTYDEDYYEIATSKGFQCMTYARTKNDTVTINFTTDLKVEENNADKIIDNTYTWVFNNKNADNKNIYIKMKRNKETNENKKDKQNFNITLEYFLIIIPLLLVFYLAYKKFKKYSDSKNKIPD